MKLPLSRRHANTWAVVLALLVLGSVGLLVGTDFPDLWYSWNHRERIAACRKALAALHELELPSTQGRQFVIYNTGSRTFRAGTVRPPTIASAGCSRNRRVNSCSSTAI